MFVALLFSCNRVEYYEKSEWHCTQEEFRGHYYDIYTEKIEELKYVYGIVCHKEEEFFQKGYYIYLYRDDFTIVIKFLNDNDLAFYNVDLYYYGDFDASRDDYKKQRSLVNFVNDFTNYVAFDTKTDKNYFESLYNECNKGEPFASNKYHYDSIVGNVGYDVMLNTDAFSYYYKMQKNNNCIAVCNCYRFEGLLKPIKTD